MWGVPGPKGFARAMAAAAVMLATLLVAACGGTGDGVRSSAAPARLVDPSGFDAAMRESGRVTINVHVPDEGSIEGTDLTIPFDEIEARRSELPDPGTPIALYCRSGNMSAEAAETLARLGYSDIVELDGGFLAWEASGRSLEPAG